MAAMAPGALLLEGAVSLWEHCRDIAAQRLTPWSPELYLSLLPIIFYWAVAIPFDVLDRLQLPAVERYRLHSQNESDGRNPVSKRQVVLRVLLQNAIQLASGVVMTLLDPEFCDSRPWRGLPYLAVEFAAAMLVMDAWQYAIHRLFHDSKFLYNAIHSTHHRLLVPYAFGALYNHPLEAFALDTMGAIMTFYATGMSCAGGVAFFTFATVKTVLDHSGYTFPVNLLHPLFPNNAAYHDTHHDLRGFRKNYSQPFFTHWDWLLGTYMDPRELRDGTAAAKAKQKPKAS